MKNNLQYENPYEISSGKCYKLIQYVMKKIKPRMIINTKDCADGKFTMVPTSYLEELSYDPTATTWMYVFVNRSLKMRKIVFSSTYELAEAMFNAEEIWWGNDIKYLNPYYKKFHDTLINIDLMND